jgi:hypothetical protein
MFPKARPSLLGCEVSVRESHLHLEHRRVKRRKLPVQSREKSTGFLLDSQPPTRSYFKRTTRATPRQSRFAGAREFARALRLLLRL